MSRSTSTRLPLVLAAGLLLLGCRDDAPADGDGDGETNDAGSETAEGDGDGDGEPLYQATIRRTSYGVAHITADDWGSLGFGQGYAFTQDKGCTLADQIVKIRSQRSRYFGPGEGNANIYSDFAFLQLELYETAQARFPEVDPFLAEAIEGYAAGYTKAIADGYIGGDCDGAAWVPTELTGVDLYAYYLNLSLLGSSWQAIAGIGAAQPPGGDAPPDPAPHFSKLSAYRGILGSNGWAIGGELSSTGRGMVMGNPHFPWEGELQLWESHLTIPGQLDVYGATLLGVPGALIGFNEQVAWTHTFSDGHRLTLYEIKSPPGEPTRYDYDGEVRDMTSREFTIDVRTSDGTLEQQTRTMWRTHYGPMLSLDPFYWTDALALSYRDANIDNYVLIEQFLRMNMASSMDEFQQVHIDVNGVPWVNTMAASADGRAWFMDSTPTPNLSQEAIDAWYARKDAGFTKAFADQDLWLLDGSTSRDEWRDDPDARAPGLIAPADLPQLERGDFVFNANDSHWLSNPLQPLTGYSPLHGFEQTPRRVRTRMNAKTLLEIAAGEGFAGADGKLDLDELAEAALSNRGFTQELLRDELVARCTGVGVWEVDGQMVDIAEACDLIAAWDGYLNLDSVGAIVWREWIGDWGYKWVSDSPTLFANPFDPADGVGTPSGLVLPQNGNDRALDALARAVVRLDGVGLALDTPLGDAQFVVWGGEKIPVTGGPRAEGVTNLMVYEHMRSTLDPDIPRAEVVYEPTYLTTEGYQFNYGSSFMMVVQFTDDGPVGKAILAYGQSAEPDSGHLTDQAHMYSQKQWRPISYREADIAADPNLVELEISGP